MNILRPVLKDEAKLANYKNIVNNEVNLYLNARHDGIGYCHYIDEDGSKSTYNLGLNKNVNNSIIGKACAFVGNGLTYIYKNLDKTISLSKQKYKLVDYNKDKEAIDKKFPKYKYLGYYDDVFCYLNDDYVDGVIFEPRTSYKIIANVLVFIPLVLSVLSCWILVGSFNTILHLYNGDLVEIFNKKRGNKRRRVI